MVDGGLVKSWSSMQTTVAQSSGEAEYYAMVRAAAEALGLQSIMKDRGWEAGVRLWVDSSAAKSMSARIGLGKVRHMEVKFLWLQQAVKDKRIEVKKIPGVRNPADALTKPKSYHEVADLLKDVKIYIEKRRPRPPHYASTEPKPVDCLATAMTTMEKKPEKTPVVEPNMSTKPEEITTAKPRKTRKPAETIATTCCRGAEPRPQPRQGSGDETRGVPYDHYHYDVKSRILAWEWWNEGGRGEVPRRPEVRGRRCDLRV